jgi:hypothetical protein
MPMPPPCTIVQSLCGKRSYSMGLQVCCLPAHLSAHCKPSTVVEVAEDGCNHVILKECLIYQVFCMQASHSKTYIQPLSAISGLVKPLWCSEAPSFEKLATNTNSFEPTFTSFHFLISRGLLQNRGKDYHSLLRRSISHPCIQTGPCARRSINCLDCP